MQPGHPGVVLLALHRAAPLIPVALFGAEDCTQNLSRLKRSDFHIWVGKRFFLQTKGEKVTRQVRQEMVEEMMYQLAVLLPPEYRGEVWGYHKGKHYVITMSIISMRVDTPANLCLPGADDPPGEAVIGRVPSEDR